MTIFTSRSNPKIKLVRSLRRDLRKARRSRDGAGFFLVEGIRHVGEAVESGAPIEYLVYAPENLTSEYAIGLIQQQSQQGVPCLAVESDVFAGIAAKENPQGLIAVVRQKFTNLDELNPANANWVVGLVSPQDPGNIGTILRTMDAVGASGLLLLENSADPTHSTAVRASMGAMFWIPIVETSFNEFATWSVKHKYHVYGTSAHGSRGYLSVTAYEKPAVLLMGSEREGLSTEQTAICESLIKLPMVGKTTSLNLSVATGVMLYEMMGKFS